MVRLVSTLTILMPTNTAQQRTADGSQTRENHIAKQSSAACAEESVDAAALLALDVLAPVGVAVSASAAAAAAAATSTAVAAFVV